MSARTTITILGIRITGKEAVQLLICLALFATTTLWHGHYHRLWRGGLAFQEIHKGTPLAARLAPGPGRP